MGPPEGHQQQVAFEGYHPHMSDLFGDEEADRAEAPGAVDVPVGSPHSPTVLGGSPSSKAGAAVPILGKPESGSGDLGA